MTMDPLSVCAVPSASFDWASGSVIMIALAVIVLNVTTLFILKQKDRHQ